MAEVIRGDLWGLFFGEQTPIGRMQRKDGHINFKLLNPSTELKDLYSINESDLDDVIDIFNDVSWSRQPLSGYLLWILWVRREIYGAHDLKDNDKFKFTRVAFALIRKEEIKDKAIKIAFDDLAWEDYLEEYDSESEAGGKYYLTSKGERVAKRMFKKKEDGVWVRAESKAKNKPTQSKKKRKNPTHKEHEQKILGYIAKFLDMCRLNEKVIKKELARECGLRPESVTRKNSKYYALIEEAESRVKKNPDFAHNRKAVEEFFFETKRKLGFE